MENLLEAVNHYIQAKETYRFAVNQIVWNREHPTQTNREEMAFLFNATEIWRREIRFEKDSIKFYAKML